MGNNFGNDFKAAHPEELNENGSIKVCIGGGAGFIGSHIAKRLKEEVSIIHLTEYFLFQVVILCVLGMLCSLC
jgi:hypothetical protein